MSNTISRASLQLGIDGVSLTTGLARLEQSIDQFSKSVNKKMHTGFSAGFTGGVVGGLLGGGLLTTIKEKLTAPFAEGEKIGDMSDALGLTPELLSSLQLGAENAGKEFDSVVMGLKHYSELIGKAKNGNEAAIKSFRDMGVSISGSYDEVFSNVIDAISKIQDKNLKQDLTSDIFGSKAALVFITILKDGIKSLEDLKQAGREFGTFMDDEKVAKLKAADDALDSLSNSAKGFWQTIAGSDVLSNTFQALTYYTQGAKNMVTDYANFFKHAWSELTGNRVINPDGTSYNLDEFNEALEKLRNVSTKIDAAIAKKDEQLAEIAAHWPNLFKPILQEFNTFEDEFDARWDEWQQGLSDSLKKTGKDLQREIDTFGKSEEEKKMYDLIQQGASGADIQKLQEQFQRLKELKAQQEADTFQMPDVNFKSAAFAGTRESTNAIAGFKANAGSDKYWDQVKQQSKNTLRTATATERIAQLMEDVGVG